MRVIAKKILRDFWKKQNDSEEQLKTWYKEASKAIWTSPVDIKSEYPRASIPIHWTHSEYDKLDAD